MKYNININQVKCIEWGLNMQQWAIMSLFMSLSTWAEAEKINWEVYYYFSIWKIIEEMPLISSNKNIFHKYIKSLKDKNLIEHILLKNKSFYKLTKLWKTYNFEWKECVKNYTPKSQGVENITHKCVKNYTQGVENITHYNNTSNNNTRIINNNTNVLLLEKKEKRKKSFSDLLKNQILKNEEFLKWIMEKFDLENQDLKNASQDFFLYWTEKNPNWKKEKWEMQKTFDVQRRFYSWLWNQKRWGNKLKSNSKIWVTTI